MHCVCLITARCCEEMQDPCSPGRCSYIFPKDSTDFIGTGEGNGPVGILLRDVTVSVPILADEVRIFLREKTFRKEKRTTEINRCPGLGEGVGRCRL